ncbi:hypothetical protein EcSMS35_1722 [Escherichia coli SMS-3-5]|uniref:Uncharacterized protein n=1 Tax=Escherichia coli (strain SMS-3-5 / SECEC) TaxID=439855 RepID=B1LFG5_ECOSM|nr:hypothetical protein EcSMS35_1722 [Escherichia coli SMS-3-5]ESD09821.1 hypothetical protein HMPREF1595_01532 [Escherichia coli 907672]
MLFPSGVFVPTLPAQQKSFTWRMKLNNHYPLTFIVISYRTEKW